ncbi:DAHL domain-containing protein [Duganella sp. Root198D2]|uniref:DAHL domain-containing protein n=1 Tax=Duganella sp. Root198D2 TaxID=1736489 RepID=UPI0009EB227B|nr:DAHL domain-containing protein [Duganella sp. Root198D2]
MSRYSRALPLPLLLVALALTSALLFFYLRSSDYHPADHFSDVATLRQLREVDENWDEAMMKLRIGMLRNYDSLSPTAAQATALPRQLDTLTSVHSASEVPGLLQAIAGYRLALNSKLRLIEAFKTHHAVLRSSLSFLPQAACDLAALLPATAEAAVQQILIPTLVYGEGNSEDELPDVAHALEVLQAMRPRMEPVAAQRLDIFTAHARAVLREAYQVGLMMQRFDAVSTAPHLERIESLLNTHQQIAARQAQLHRQLLLLFAAALTGLLLYAAWRLIHSHTIIGRFNRQLQHANDQLEIRVAARTAELESANVRLQAEIAERCALEGRLVHSEKLASLGQLAAGVAHEINNPLGFLSSNFGMLDEYLRKLFDMLDSYEAAERAGFAPQSTRSLVARRAELQLDFLRQDIPLLMEQSHDGMSRVSKIVQSLKDFSRAGPRNDWQWADLHQGIDSTLHIIASDLRKVAEVRKEYGRLPQVECRQSELNQVFLNLLVNAGHAIGSGRGVITIRSGHDEEEAWVEIADDGCGIAPDVLPRIFDPFYTTKAVGKGTGLGLSVSHGIVRNHGGHIDVQTAPGCGTTFRVVLPVKQSAPCEFDACLNPG